MAKNPAIDNLIRIPTTLNGSFFRLWVRFISPYHNLTEREIDVFTCLLKYRFKLEKEIMNQDILDKVVMSDDVKRDICQELGITLENYNVLLSNLKKKKVIIDGIINKKFVPSIAHDAKDFKLMLYFEFKDDIQ